MAAEQASLHGDMAGAGVGHVRPPVPALELLGAGDHSGRAVPIGSFSRGYPLGEVRRRDALLLLLSRVLLTAVTLAITIQAAMSQLPLLLLVFIGAGWFLVLHVVPDVLPPGVALGARARIVVRAVAMTLLTALFLAIVPETVLSSAQLIRAGVVLILLSIPLELWRDTRRTPMRVLVIGRDGGGADLARSLSASPNEWVLTGLVDGGEDGEDSEATPLEVVVRDGHPDLIVLSDAPGRDAALDLLLAMWRPSFRIVSLDHFFEFACGRISIWRVSPVWFMSLLHAYSTPYRAATKRLLDLSISLLVLLVTWPLMIVIALLVRTSGPGPILYRQTRVGEASRQFEMLKFRTMSSTAETDGREVWAAVDDPRITRVGRYLRRYRLDELPQILNIIRGDMSFVGPRPERPGLAQGVGEAVPHWSRRLMVRPGITGWAQVRHGYTDSEIGAAEKLAYDLYYVKHQSLAFDLAIALKTFGVIFRGSGSR